VIIPQVPGIAKERAALSSYSILQMVDWGNHIDAIGTKQTSSMSAVMSVVGGEADMANNRSA